MPTPTKPNSRNLERVRINQQRSRDRKRAYTADLERKIKQLELALHHSDQSTRSNEADHTSSRTDGALAKLTHENRVRGDLLRVLGIDTETQDRFIQTAPMQAESSELSAASSEGDEAHPSHPEENLQHQEVSQELTFGFSVPSGQFDALTGLQTTSVPASDFGTDFSTLIGPLLTSLPSPLPSTPTLCSNCSSTSPQRAPQRAPHFPAESTTACSIAFSMVLSHNKRGDEFNDLESRMRVGYQKSMAPGEECRILNKVLFEILADIT